MGGGGLVLTDLDNFEIRLTLRCIFHQSKAIFFSEAAVH